MSKQRHHPLPARPRETATAVPAAASAHGGLSPGAMREVVESIVIAFVLAFLFRTFEAEAFVIPTGSMAPTLMGRHKDLTCSACGYAYQVSASAEVNENGDSDGEVVSATCPLCRFTMDVSPSNPQQGYYPSYNGDRILVGKFPYQFGDPDRWDVAVFKYPGGARTNYIKRLTGLPGETIRIRHGDLYVEKAGEPETIARKPPDKIRAMLQPVYDNDHQPSPVKEGQWLPRWSPEVEGLSTPHQWVPGDEFQSFHAEGAIDSASWIAYEHRVPSYDHWRRYLGGGWQPTDTIEPQLITDFTAYNAGVMLRGSERGWMPPPGARDAQLGLRPPADLLGLHWVGDLAVECELEVADAKGEALFELVEGGRHFQAHIDLATGRARFTIDDAEVFDTVTSMAAPGTYQVMFANVDDQLVLEVDGTPAVYAYAALENNYPRPDDLKPARIGSRGARLTVRHVQLRRDIYYIAQRYGSTPLVGGSISEFDAGDSPYRHWTADDLKRVDPREWSRMVPNRQVEFTLGEGQYLAMGDNSAASKDSRLWEGDPGTEFYVSRELLIGKALAIYWPHSLHRIPGTSIPIRFFPNFWRMKFVR